MITENRKKATDVRPETVQKPPEPVADRTDGQAQQNEKTPFPPFRRELDEYLFRQGTAHRAWEYLGAQEEGDQIVFRVWAPHAVQVALVGSFCDWENGIPMQRAGRADCMSSPCRRSACRTGHCISTAYSDGMGISI